MRATLLYFHHLELSKKAHAHLLSSSLRLDISSIIHKSQQFVKPFLNSICMTNTS